MRHCPEAENKPVKRAVARRRWKAGKARGGHGAGRIGVGSESRKAGNGGGTFASPERVMVYAEDGRLMFCPVLTRAREAAHDPPPLSLHHLSLQSCWRWPGGAAPAWGQQWGASEGSPEEMRAGRHRRMQADRAEPRVPAQRDAGQQGCRRCPRSSVSNIGRWARPASWATAKPATCSAMSAIPLACSVRLRTPEKLRRLGSGVEARL